MSGFLYRRYKNSTVIKSRLFPFNTNKYKPKNHVSLIGVGGNLGDVKREFIKLFYYLNRGKKVKVLSTSIIYKNPPFGYLEQPYFYNTLFLIESKLKPLALLRYLQSVERHFKRERLFKDAPRTLDLDIIFYEKLKIDIGRDLNIPHPYWSSRESVLVPLKYMKGAKCLTRVL